MSLKRFTALLLAVAHQAAGQLVDDSWKGQGTVLVIEGSDYPWGPDDPLSSKVGCLNADGKLIADNGNCAVLDANVTHLLSETGECGWAVRAGEGAQPSVLTCSTPTPTYYGFYRLNNQREPIYLSYGSGYLGWSADARPTGDQIVDLYQGQGWADIDLVLLWSPV